MGCEGLEPPTQALRVRLSLCLCVSYVVLIASLEGKLSLNVPDKAHKFLTPVRELLGVTSFPLTTLGGTIGD